MEQQLGEHLMPLKYIPPEIPNGAISKPVLFLAYRGNGVWVGEEVSMPLPIADEATFQEVKDWARVAVKGGIGAWSYTVCNCPSLQGHFASCVISKHKAEFNVEMVETTAPLSL
jgi:hypothetical protein